jgi:hypothetical protein
VDAMGGAGDTDGEKKKKKQKMEEMLIVSEAKLGEYRPVATTYVGFPLISISVHHQQNPANSRSLRFHNSGSIPRYPTATRITTRRCGF